MALPALLWAGQRPRLLHPVNFKAGMLLPGPGNLDAPALGSFHWDWFLAAAALHAVLSLCFGVLFALVTPVRLPACRGRFPWGGLVLPLVWTGITYGLMGVVNPRSSGAS